MIRLVAWLSAIVLVAGAFGRFWAPLDSLALLRVPAALLLLATCWRLPRLQRWPALAVAVLALASWAWLRVPVNSEGDDLVLYQKNSFFRNPTPEALAEDILGSGADVVTLQELSSRNRALTEVLEAEYPLRHDCESRRWSVTVMTRLPAGPATPLCSEQRGFAALQVMTDKGPVWIVSVHLYWPWPHPGWGHGVPWPRRWRSWTGRWWLPGISTRCPGRATVRRIAEAARGRVIGPERASLKVDAWGVLSGRAGWTGMQAQAAGPRYIPMPIDHVIAPSGRVEHRPLLGSDHQGLLAHIDLEG